jgi:tRNA pseudouridine38-40 synthase
MSERVTRFVLGLEYDGSDFSGWQRQGENAPNTIQQTVEEGLSKIAGDKIATVCAGRTDAGVHATQQVVHFDSFVDRGAKAWTVGVNSQLPRSIRILWVRAVNNDFSARFSAVARRYMYVIRNRDVSSAFLNGKVTHIAQELEVGAMHEAAQALVGEHDFTSFRAAACQSKSPNRNVEEVSVVRHTDHVIITVVANAFLQHMVRNIVGTLISVGRGDCPISWVKNVLDQRDRTKAGITSPPHGLYLTGVSYSPECALPELFVSPPVLAGFI